MGSVPGRHNLKTKTKGEKFTKEREIGRRRRRIHKGKEAERKWHSSMEV
jgi:hypothetical protein